MATNGRNRPARPSLIIMLAAGAILALAGCSSGTQQGVGNSHLTAQGTSVPGWLTTPAGPSLHSRSATDDFVADGSVGCVECHGADLAGGISKVSCLASACHHDPVAGFPNPAVHGAQAKKAPGSSGFASCQICHGADFSRIFGRAGRCFDCHGVSAPHPAAPWRSPTFTHTDTNVANAPVCARCHFPGSANNPPNHPATPAPAGTPPGCFNNTLCHGAEAAPHALGAVWRDPAAGGASFHGTQAKQDLTFCRGCHGAPPRSFDGGVAATACSSCHPAAKAHPTDWQGVRAIGGASITHRTSTSPTNPAGQCALCHKVDGPGTGPDPGAPSCFSASFTNANGQARTCHSGGPGAANHAVPFLAAAHTTATTTSFGADCGNCHSLTGSSSPVPSAPVCSVCHTNTAVNPLTTKTCASCHASPPDNASTAAYPNVAGAHAVHLALNGGGSPVACDTCHAGLGTGTQAHYDRANGRTGAGGRVPPGDAAFAATYNAKTGSAAFDNAALACSRVSCHGGQATPNWRTGAIDVNTQCGSCHQLGDSTAGASPQYNVYFSGRHKKHVVGEGVPCTTCHSTALLAAVHFDDLASTGMTQARSTLRTADLTFNGSVSPPTCNPSAGAFPSGCHGSKSWTQETLP